MLLVERERDEERIEWVMAVTGAVLASSMAVAGRRLRMTVTIKTGMEEVTTIITILKTPW